MVQSKKEKKKKKKLEKKLRQKMAEQNYWAFRKIRFHVSLSNAI